MANEQEAGSIVVALKAQIEGLLKGVAQAKATLEGFAKGVQGAAAGVQKSGQAIGEAFGVMDRQAVRAAAGYAKFTSRLIGLQFALGVLSQRGSGFGALSQAISAGTAGLTTFAAVASIMPTKLGLVIGAVSALTVAIFDFITLGIRKAVEATQSVTDRSIEAEKAVSALRVSLEDAAKIAETFGSTVGERTAAKLSIARTAYEQNLKKVRELKAELLALNNAVGTDSEKPGDKGRIGVVEQQILNTERQLADAEKGGLTLVSQANVGKLQDSIVELGKTAQVAMGVVEGSLKAGLITPLEAAQEELSLAGGRLRELLGKQGELQAQLASTQDAGVRQALTAQIRTLSTDIGEAMSGVAKAQIKLAAEQAAQDAREAFDRDFIQPTTQALSSAISNGILAGASSMEILADLGKQLFSNFVQTTVSSFLTGMTAALQQISAVAGTVFSGLIQAAVGIAGFFLAQQGQEESQESFSDIRSNIESSRELRGVVAGPSSVAIATVGEDIGRAFAPAVERLDLVVRFLVSIERNTRGGGGPSGGGGSDFVAVPTA